MIAGGNTRVIIRVNKTECHLSPLHTRVFEEEEKGS